MSFYWSLKLTGQLFVSGWKKKYCISAFLISLPSRSCETNHTQTGNVFFLKIKTLRVVLIRQTLELTCPFVPASVPIFYTSQHTWNNDLPISSQIMTGGTETFRWRCQCFSLITPLLHWGDWSNPMVDMCSEFMVSPLLIEVLHELKCARSTVNLYHRLY